MGPPSFTIHVQILLLVLSILWTSASGNSPFKKFFRKSVGKKMSNSLISRNPDDVKFYLYNDPNDEFNYIQLDYKYHIMDMDNGTKSLFMTDKPLKVIIHGFLGGFKTRSVSNIKNAYLTHQLRTGNRAANILCVDWSRLAQPRSAINVLLYNLAVGNVKTVGRRIGEFLGKLLQQGVTRPELIHLVGFSLGSHVASSAAVMVKQLFNGQLIGRVTGLDPARLSPLKQRQHLESQARKYKVLNKGDAQFVDVVHTGAGRLGMREQIGHVDFYVNGGIRQPICEDDTSSGFLDWLTNAAETVSGTCSHFKAAQYYASSITDKLKLQACKCYSWGEYKYDCGAICSPSATFGEECSNKTRGRYYLEI